MPKKKENENDNKEIVHKWYWLRIRIGEIIMISRFLKVDVVLDDLIALGKELSL